MKRARGIRALVGPAALLVCGGLLLGVGGRYVVLDEAHRFRWLIIGVGLICGIVGTHRWYLVRDRQRLLARLARAGANVAGIVRRVLPSKRIVEYEYSAGGGRHAGRTQALSRDLVDGLDHGATVTVIYDVRHPSRSVLELERYL